MPLRLRHLRANEHIPSQAKVEASIAPNTCRPRGWCSYRHNRVRCISGASSSDIGVDCLDSGSRRRKLIVAGQATSGHRAQCSFSRAGGKHLEGKRRTPRQETRNKATRWAPAASSAAPMSFPNPSVAQLGPIKPARVSPARASRERSPEVNLWRPVRARRGEAAGRSERRTLPRRKEISRRAERAKPGGVRCAAPGPA